MKILLRCLIGTALCAGMVVLLRAQDLAPERTKGTVLLLKNGHAMEGEIERIGAQLRVRSGKGEVWITGEKSARLCADWDDAFLYVQTLIKPNDAGERVKLARWCHLHRLSEKALEQARQAMAIQPDHSEAKQLVLMLERAKKVPSESPRVVSAPTPMKPRPPAPTVDVTSEALIAFTTKVQPILMNTCAACHANGHTGKFTLERVAETGSKSATQRNLAAVLDQVDLDHPRISPLLIRAITPHGGEQTAPIRGRDAKAFQAMHHWIEQTIATNPQLKDYRAVNKKAVTSAQPLPQIAEPNSPMKPKNEKSVAQALELAQEKQARQLAPRPDVPAQEPAPTPRPLPVSVTQAPTPVMEPDPFDPEPFNRHFHANRIKPIPNP